MYIYISIPILFIFQKVFPKQTKLNITIGSIKNTVIMIISSMFLFFMIFYRLVILSLWITKFLPGFPFFGCLPGLHVCCGINKSCTKLQDCNPNPNIIPIIIIFFISLLFFIIYTGNIHK